MAGRIRTPNLDRWRQRRAAPVFSYPDRSVQPSHGPGAQSSYRSVHRIIRCWLKRRSIDLDHPCFPLLWESAFLKFDGIPVIFGGFVEEAAVTKLERKRQACRSFRPGPRPAAKETKVGQTAFDGNNAFRPPDMERVGNAWNRKGLPCRAQIALVWGELDQRINISSCASG